MGEDPDVCDGERLSLFGLPCHFRPEAVHPEMTSGYHAPFGGEAPTPLIGGIQFITLKILGNGNLYGQWLMLFLDLIKLKILCQTSGNSPKDALTH